MIDLESLVNMEKCLFKGNELLFFKQDYCNSSRIVSTGEKNVFKLEKSIRKGIIAESLMDITGVANYFVEQSVNGAKVTQNFLFPKGLDDAIEICRNVYKQEIKPLIDAGLVFERCVRCGVRREDEEGEWSKDDPKFCQTCHYANL